MSSGSSKERGDDYSARDTKYVVRPWPQANEPVIITSGKDCEITDAYGKTFIDFTAGYFVNQAGHCHPRVVKAAAEQLGKITQVSHRHSTPAMIDLAEKLVKLSPRKDAKVFFTTGGSEATEFAMRMARQNKKKTDIAYLDNAYHGLSLGALAACAAQKYRDSAGVPMGDYTYALPNSYPYRCTCKDNCIGACLDEAEKRLDARPNTAAIIAEPVQAVGGLAPARGWWDRLDAMRKKRGLLLIADEIQTGMGRTGKMFACEHYGLAPDIITVGKGLSGGVGSLGAVIVTPEVEAGFFGGTTPTSAANAVSAAAGIALIDTLIDEKLVENAAKMGEYFTKAVWKLEDAWVGDVRFCGLLGGVELVSNRQTKDVLAKDLVGKVKDRLHEDGFLITVSGTHGNVLRLQPPLTIKSSHIDGLVGSLSKALREVRGTV